MSILPGCATASPQVAQPKGVSGPFLNLLALAVVCSLGPTAAAQEKPEETLQRAEQLLKQGQPGEALKAVELWRGRLPADLKLAPGASISPAGGSSWRWWARSTFTSSPIGRAMTGCRWVWSIPRRY